jgi:AraC-like DNA-binding protein
MKHQPAAYNIPFDAYGTLFESGPERFLRSKPCSGSGGIQVFNLEKGLQVLLCDCMFNKALEMQGSARPENKEPYFTLAFFTEVQRLQFGCNNDTLLEKNSIWDTAFIPSGSGFRMYVPPRTRVHCLSINFSRKWLHHNIPERREDSMNLIGKLQAAESFPLLEYMSACEKKLVLELLGSSENAFGSFYIKSCVLKLISDFFIKVKERGDVSFGANPIDSLLAEAEKELCDHVTGKMPTLENIASKYRLSSSTLKRHFTKKFGVNLFRYFISKKMEYARRLINEENVNALDAARLVGYKNMSHFLAMYNKH